MAFDVVEAGEQLARSALRDRDFAQEQRDAAIASGNKKDARKWDSELRKWEKLIAQYGLDRA